MPTLMPAIVMSPDEGQILVAHRPGGEGEDLLDLSRILDRQGREDGRPVEAEGPEDADVEEGPGASGRIEAGDGEQGSWQGSACPGL